MNHYDAIIIGFGKAGKTLAADLAKRGKSVAVIEKSDKMYGGTCINIGCIPTKTLVHLAKAASQMKNATFEMRADFYKKAIGTKNMVTAALREKNYRNLADHPNVHILHGKGFFTSGNTVRVMTENGHIDIQSYFIVVNTGSQTILPNIEGVKDNPFVYTSTSMMELETLPRRLTIIGGGYIGLEFASMYASFGSAVTVLESYPVLIGREDRDIADCVKETLEKKGVKFILNTKVQWVEKKRVCCMDSTTGESSTIESDAILLATGRRPYTDGLNLAAAGVETDDRGAIKVDERLMTTNPNIRAVGDVKGGLQFTYISLDDYRIIRDDLFGARKRRLSDREYVAYSVFIDPPFARIGINEEEARKMKLNFSVRKLPVMAIPRAKTLGETDGMLKAIIDNKTNKILGCMLFAPDSSEVINIVAAAMRTGQDYTFLRDFIFTHPSMSEALNDLFA
jgi:pyruvate/2-oxoglutarate dehydrogenase complex dihydrolipoamide dehydrogenase (E3) component